VSGTDGAEAVDIPAPAGREAWIEWGRVLAILAVIAIHVASPLVTRTDHPASWWFGNVIESLTRWCVPLFVMISGGLLLGSPRTAEVGSFYRRRLLRLGPPLVFWVAFYLIFGHLVAGVPRDLLGALRSIALGRPYFHLYFPFLIGGLYAAAPWLRLLVAVASRRQLTVAIAVAFVLGMTDTLINSVLGIGSPNAVTRFIPYIGYFLAGFLLRQTVPSKARIGLVSAIVAMAIAATAVGTWALIDVTGAGLNSGRYLYEYLSVTTVPAALGIYQLLRWSAPRLEERNRGVLGRLVFAVGAASFGVYLVHPTILVGLESVGITARWTAAPLAFVTTAGIAFLVSLGLVLVARRVPGVRRVV
jgi:surface polysaccharide O-acyltransferase-like enzyme